jgi:hypothetical protein
VLEVPIVLLFKAFVPTAVFNIPVVLPHKALVPTAILSDAVLENKLLTPRLTLLTPFILHLKEL